MVPADMQEKIRALIISKAERRIEAEMRQLKEIAQMELEIMNGTFRRDDPKYFYWSHPHLWRPNDKRQGIPFYGYDMFRGYGHIPPMLTKEQEDEYVRQLRAGNQRSPSPRQRGDSKISASSSSQPFKKSHIPSSSIDLLSGNESPTEKNSKNDISDSEARKNKFYARERARAYDQSIKNDILYCGREGSMNITYDPFYHGPYHPYYHPSYYPYGYTLDENGKPVPAEKSPRRESGKPDVGNHGGQ